MAKVWVVGSINMDLVAFAPRHPGVGETVLGTDLHRFPGGKGANQAVAAARAGVETTIIGAVGEDDFGTELTGFLATQGVDTSAVATAAGNPTGTALIVVALADNTIVVIPGANSKLSISDVSRSEAFGAGDVVLAQLETPQATTVAAFERARAAGATTVLNAAPAASLRGDLLGLVDHLVVNETELELLRSELQDAASPTVICTLGPAGVLTTAAGASTRTPGIAVEAVDTTGAGDCFAGYLAAGLSAGLTLAASVERANRAAALSTTRAGAAPSMPYSNELDQPS